MIKKILCLILTLILIIPCFSITIFASAKTESNEEFTPSYEVNAPDWTDEELLNYYIENDIHPTNNSAGTTPKKLYLSGVKDYLNEKFPEYSWNAPSQDDVHDVSKIYGENPYDVDEDADYIQTAKTKANITHTYLGCGTLAMVCQFDFLGRIAKYSSIYDISSEDNKKINIATEIFKTTNVFAGEDWGQEGTLVFPNSAINASRKILENHNLAVGSNKSKSLIYVYGDIIPSVSSFEKKTENIIKSIDKGMPVIWWTMGDKNEDFANHYMNIFGYEYWTGEKDGKQSTHLMFKLRYNWGINDIYLDSDILKSMSGGFIYFEETHDRTFITPEDYNYPCSYNSNMISNTVTTTFKNETTTFTVNRLRAGYVKHYDKTNTIVDGNYLTLSAKRQNAGTAYLMYSFDKAISHISLETSWWSGKEGISSGSGYALIRYRDSNGNWKTAQNIMNISSLIEKPNRMVCQFENSATAFEIIVECYTPTGNSNKGRLVIGDMSVIFAN